LPENGEVETVKIQLFNRLRFIGLCLSYPSQVKTWIGLFPFFLFHYFFFGTQALQKVSLERLNNRPHAGSLYYERRKFSSWEMVCYHLNLFEE
jgi:hypothetical protein